MANAKTSSFVRKGKIKSPQIPGTRAATHCPLLLVSTGMPSFDSIIGGGFPVGSLILLDDDKNGTFGKLFMKYFLAEGVLSGQAIHVCSRDIDPRDMVNQLPGSVEVEINEDCESVDDNMKIAWRYQNMKLVSPVKEGHYFCHYFDLIKTIDPTVIENSEISYYTCDQVSTSDSFKASKFNLLLQSIKGKLQAGNYFANNSVSERKILRLGLFQIGSPLWPKTEEYLPIFLYHLRALVRNSFSLCMINVPFHLYQDKDLISKCTHLSDLCIKVESFSGTPLENNIALRDYSGSFRLVKWSAMNGLVTGGSPYVDLALKLRRKKLVIEKLHLPPDLDESADKEQDKDCDVGCGSSQRRLLDF